MFDLFKRTMLLALIAFLAVGPVSAQPVFTTTFENGIRVKGGLTVVDGGTSISGVVALPGAVSVGSLTSTSAVNVTSGGLIVTAGGLTVSAGAVSVPSITASTPIVNASIGNGAKRQILQFAVNGGASCADSTTYQCLLIPGRAGIVKAINFVAATPPVGGTDTLIVKKGSSAGNTMLSAASVDATTLVANTVLPGTLTATSADLAITATQPIYVSYVSGVQTTDAINMNIQIEFEPNDF